MLVFPANKVRINECPMIDLYTWPTSNGHKVHIMLEECGLPYKAHPIVIGKGEQFQPAFLKISPNNKTPAMIDRDGPGGKEISLFESGAILFYLAEKTGRFSPAEPMKRHDTMQWLMFQMSSVGPMLGQAHYFYKYGPDHFERARLEIGIDRYVRQSNRLYNVMDLHLAGREWFAAGEYTIADMAVYPWLRMPSFHGVEIEEYPNVKRWRDKIAARPAVQRALEVLKEHNRFAKHTDAEWDIQFGATQYARRDALGNPVTAKAPA
jgi:GST-like protein